MDSLDVVGPCETTMWAWIRASATPAAGDGLRKLDIDLCTDAGEVRVRMLGLTSRVVTDDPAGLSLAASADLADRDAMPALVHAPGPRSAGRRVGEGGVCKCRSRWSPEH